MTPTAVQLAGWLACLFFIAAGVNQLLKLKATLMGEKKDISPQPLSVQLTSEFVRERDCLARHATIANDVADIRRQRENDERQASIHRKTIYERLNAMIAEDRTSREKIHERINEVLAAVSRLEGRLGRNHQ